MNANRKRLKQGLVQVYFGRGKGKTTAAIGQGIRATGHGFRVFMIQFMKGNYKYGEIEAISNIPNFELKQFGSPDLIAEPGEFDLEQGKKALDYAKDIINAMKRTNEAAKKVSQEIKDERDEQFLNRK